MRPPPPEKPRTSVVTLLLAGVLAAMVFTALYFLTIGLFGPVLMVGLLVFGMGALQYVVWGWWVAHVLAEDAGDDEEVDRSFRPPVDKE